MDYRRVCAIDAGTRNFAFCVCDNWHWRTPLVWRHEDLWQPAVNKRGKPTLQDVIRITHEWCTRNRLMLNACDVIVLENQLRKTFIAMNTVIQALFYDKVKVVHPMRVAAFFKLPKQREPKKLATVKLCREFAQIPGYFGDKVDDLADAWIMAVHALVHEQAISAKYFSEEGGVAK